MNFFIKAITIGAVLFWGLSSFARPGSFADWANGSIEQSLDTLTTSGHFGDYRQVKLAVKDLKEAQKYADSLRKDHGVTVSDYRNMVSIATKLASFEKRKAELSHFSGVAKESSNVTSQLRDYASLSKDLKVKIKVQLDDVKKQKKRISENKKFDNDQAARAEALQLVNLKANVNSKVRSCVDQTKASKTYLEGRGKILSENKAKYDAQIIELEAEFKKSAQQQRAVENARNQKMDSIADKINELTAAAKKKIADFKPDSCIAGNVDAGSKAYGSCSQAVSGLAENLNGVKAKAKEYAREYQSYVDPSDKQVKAVMGCPTVDAICRRNGKSAFAEQAKRAKIYLDAVNDSIDDYNNVISDMKSSLTSMASKNKAKSEDLDNFKIVSGQQVADFLALKAEFENGADSLELESEIAGAKASDLDALKKKVKDSVGIQNTRVQFRLTAALSLHSKCNGLNDELKRSSTKPQLLALSDKVSSSLSLNERFTNILNREGIGR